MGNKNKLKTTEAPHKKRYYDEIRVTSLCDERCRDGRDPSFRRQVEIRFHRGDLEFWMARANDDEWSLDEFRGQYLEIDSSSPVIFFQTPTLDSLNGSEVEVDDAEDENQFLVDNSFSDCQQQWEMMHSLVSGLRQY